MKKLLLPFLLFVALPLAAQTTKDVCPTIIGLTKSGTVYDLNVPNMPALRRSRKMLEEFMKGGCYNDAHWSPVTSVTLKVATGTPSSTVDKIYAVFARGGWPKVKVLQTVWPSAPAQ